MRSVTKTQHPSAASPASLSDFESNCGPHVKGFTNPWARRSKICLNIKKNTKNVGRLIEMNEKKTGENRRS